MKICVIIPAFNEEKTIQGLIRSVKRFVPDVLVINDGSSDRTEELAKAAGAVVLDFKHNVGKGKVLKDGFDYAVKNNYDAVIAMDADGQHSPDDIVKIIEDAAPPKVGIVVGNRMAAPGEMPLSRFITNLFMSLILSIVCRQNIPDTQCGFRLIKCEVLRKTRLFSLNYEIESELLIKTSRLGYRIVSVPIKSVYEGQLSLINPILDTWRFLIMSCRILITK
ncbi:MAG: glycosyltransferase family 2 protein [Candidatus Omnitrophica bacterium]|nr:glycosyltransferase family 2 protein [Candidatus Omnitrophota bacterium]